MHVIDCATIEPGRDPLADLDVIERELAAYGGLEDRPRLVALNKIDVPDGRELAEMVGRDLEARGLAGASRSSAASHEGLRELTFAMAEMVAQAARERPAPTPTRIVIRPPRGAPAVRSSRSGRPARAGGSAARSPSAGSGRPTSATTRPSATWPTGSTGSASRRSCSSSAREEGDAVLIGDADNAVVFDFKPVVARRRGDARPARGGPAVRGEPARRRASPGHRRSATVPAARGRPAPTWPAGPTPRPIRTTPSSAQDVDFGWTRTIRDLRGAPVTGREVAAPPGSW